MVVQLRIFFIGLVLCVVGMYSWFTAQRDKKGFPIEGVVVDNRKEKSGRDRIGRRQWKYYPVVEYTSPTTGERERMTSGSAYTAAFDVGAPVEMRYDSDTERVNLAVRSGGIGLVFLLIGLALLALSLLID